ncbi:MFS transporter [Sulfurisphaera javensis]|uniref:MFS transporter n=1 Tax=Sulfurisphaera javensis TaxID=2049879 RepID=A0AAT9GMW4_9CREN
MILAIGFIIMSFNSLYQYAWNAFLPHLKIGLRATLPEIEVAFTLFTIFSTTFQIIGGNIADSKGPRKIGIISSILSATGFLGSSFSSSLYQFYFFWSIGSIGEGILYGIAANLAVKWFKKTRGFATGFVSLGFGLGSVLVNPFIYSFYNYRMVMFLIGLLEIIILPVMLSFVDYPKEVKGEKPKDVLKTGKWWLIYFSFALSAVPLTIYSSSLSVVANGNVILLITIFPLLSGISRPILGYISDILGRLTTLLVTLTMMIIGSILFLVNLILPSVLVIGFFGGSLITLYFSIVGDIFGEKFSTSNNAILYTGKAVAGVLGGFTFSLLYDFSPTIAKEFGLISAIAGLLLLLSKTVPMKA